MGVFHYFYMFIGRKCTPEEAHSFYVQLNDMADPKLKYFHSSYVLDLEWYDAYFTIKEGDIIYTVVCEGHFKEGTPKENELEWYVCQDSIECFEDRYPENKPLNPKDIPVPYDERYGIMGIFDVSY